MLATSSRKDVPIKARFSFSYSSQLHPGRFEINHLKRQSKTTACGIMRLPLLFPGATDDELGKDWLGTFGTPPTNEVVVHPRLTVEESMGAIIIPPPQDSSFDSISLVSFASYSITRVVSLLQAVVSVSSQSGKNSSYHASRWPCI